MRSKLILFASAIVWISACGSAEADIVSGDHELNFSGNAAFSTGSFTVPGGNSGSTGLPGSTFAYSFSSGLTSTLTLSLTTPASRTFGNSIVWSFDQLNFDGISQGVSELNFVPSSSTPGTTVASSSFTLNEFSITTGNDTAGANRNLTYVFEVVTAPEPSHYGILLLGGAVFLILRRKSVSANANRQDSLIA